MKKHILCCFVLLLPLTLEAQPTRLAEQFNQRGLARFDKGDVEGAIAEFDQLLDLVTQLHSKQKETPSLGVIDPRAAHAYSNRGSARFAKGDFDGAHADFDKALRINPRLAEIWFNRAVIQHEQGDYDGAKKDYTKAISLNERYDRAYFNRGVVRLAQQDYEAARTDFNVVLQLNPRDAAAYSNRGTALYALGQSAAALADFDQAIALEKDAVNLATVLRNRGKVRLDSGDFARAIVDFTAALAMNPNFALAYANRGIAYLRQGNETLAEADFARCLQLDRSLETSLQEQIQKVKEQQKRLK